MDNSEELFSKHCRSLGYLASKIPGNSMPDFLVTSPSSGETICVAEVKSISPGDWWNRDPKTEGKFKKRSLKKQFLGGPLSIRHNNKPGFLEKSTRQLAAFIGTKELPGMIVLRDSAPMHLIGETVIRVDADSNHPFLSGHTHLFSEQEVQAAMFGSPTRTALGDEFPWVFRLSQDAHREVSAVAVLNEIWVAATQKFGLRIYHNPYCNFPLPLKAFNGAYDSDWGWKKDFDIIFDNPRRL